MPSRTTDVALLLAVLSGAAGAAEPATASRTAAPPPPEHGVTMKVRFPDGRPVIWWPASEEGAGAHEPVGFGGIATGMSSSRASASRTTALRPGKS